MVAHGGSTHLLHITIPNNWNPRFYQVNLWKALQEGCKRVYAVWHRRAGKDDVCLHWTASSAMQRVGNYWHMLPEAAQARKAIWSAVNPHTGKKRIDEAFPLEIRKKTRDNEMMIEFINGSTWQVLGSDNYNSQVGSAPVGIIFSEWALADPSAWAYMRPILAENGGWALFITTPRGRNHAKTMYDHAVNDEAWFCESLDAEKTNVFTKETLENEQREYISQFGPDDGLAKFHQEYYCSFDSALAGSYWGTEVSLAEKEGRILNIPVDPLLPVSCFFDFGRGASNSTSIWFMQMVGYEPRFIDYEEGNSGDIAHYGKLLKEKDYMYDKLYLPHDAAHERLATGLSYEEQFKKMGFKTRIIPRTNNLSGDIAATNAFIRQSAFDKRRCERGIECLRSYSRDWDEANKTFKPTPNHNWASHGADSFRTATQANALGLLTSKKKSIANFQINNQTGSFMGV